MSQKNRKKVKKGTGEIVKITPFADRDSDQSYACAIKMLGNRRLIVKCEDGKERLAIIPGKFKGKKYWVSPGMILLVNTRNYQDEKVDVIYVYNNDETKFLKRKKEIENLLENSEEKDNNDIIFTTEELNEETTSENQEIKNNEETTSENQEIKNNEEDEIDIDEL